LAKGNANKTILNSQALASSFIRVQDQQSKAYSSMREGLNQTSSELLHYIKSKLVRDRVLGNMVINLETPEEAV
jgi:hypothetical protein